MIIELGVKRNFKIILVFIFFSLLYNAVWCKDVKNYSVPEDTSEIKYSKIKEFSLDRYRTDPDYTYDKNIVSINYWQKFINWLTRKMNLRAESVISTFLNRWLWFLIFFGLVLFIIIKLFGSDIMGFFYRNKTIPLTMQSLEEDINEINFEDQILSAIKQGNFRYAIRLYYLQSLKELNDRQLISWQIDKTNRDYYYELSGKNIQAPFEGITTLFNWIWYGDKPIDQHSFQTAAEQFKHFNLKLKTFGR
jgi:hypothetical protein